MIFRPDKKVEDMVNSILKNSARSSIPDSISVLINFGPYHNQIMYSTESEEHNCQVCNVEVEHYMGLNFNYTKDIKNASF